MIAFFGVRRSGNHAYQEEYCHHMKLRALLYHDMKIPLRPDWAELTSKRRIIGPIDGKGEVMIAFEDQPVADIGQDITIVILRSAYNAFASRICATSENLFKRRARNQTQALDAWVDHAQHDHEKYEDIDFSYARTHRPSWADSNYNDRWKRVSACQWDWEDLWQEVLDREDVRELHQKLYGWSLNREGQMQS